jgi:3-dehydroquinate synthetase
MGKIVDLSELKKINAMHFLEIVKKDKKNKKNQIRLILTKGFGKMFMKNFSNNLEFISLLKKYFLYIANFKMTSSRTRGYSGQ